MSNESRPMNPNQARHAEIPEPSLTPIQGWHCGHYFYRWNREALQRLSSDRMAFQQGIQQFEKALSPSDDARTERFQSFIVSGHKADFGLVMMDPDPLKIDRVHQVLLSGFMGAAIEPTYSFVSVSEVSEYLPTREQYAQKLLRSGENPASPSFEAKVNSYEKRLPMMLAHRLSPEFPEWPAMCFYPMNKVRNVGANWFLLPFSERTEMMAEHAQSGMAFAGRVTQLVTASVGLDDWEWGVTLWAKNPQYLKDIVYTMRFDQASARFGQFGPFYTCYLATPSKILEHCCIV
jgi:hydrogen peroxide-dependent heme synthase